MLGLPFIYNKLAKEGTTPAKASSTQVATDPHQQTYSSCAGGVGSITIDMWVVFFIADGTVF
jgi:hypothetical protein